MRVRILDLAERDLKDGALFYEKQSVGLGDYFLNSLGADISSLAEFGGIHRKVYGQYQLLAKKFPYAIYYEVMKNIVLVNAVIDCRRDPQWIKKRIAPA